MNLIRLVFAAGIGFTVAGNTAAQRVGQYDETFGPSTLFGEDDYVFAYQDGGGQVQSSWFPLVDP